MVRLARFKAAISGSERNSSNLRPLFSCSKILARGLVSVMGSDLQILSVVYCIKQEPLPDRISVILKLWLIQTHNLSCNRVRLFLDIYN